jgi:antitoxin ParD1/3/4
MPTGSVPPERRTGRLGATGRRTAEGRRRRHPPRVRESQSLSTVDMKATLCGMARQTRLNVSLTPVLRKYVQSKVSSGRYESASEVVRDAIRALQERAQAAALWSEVRAKVAVARHEVAEGKTVDGGTAMEEIVAELEDERPKVKGRRRWPR